MKLASFIHADARYIGAVDIEINKVLPLQVAHTRQAGEPHAALSSMMAFIETGPAALNVASDLVETSADEDWLHLTDVRLLAPLPRPKQIRDFLLFEEHIKNGIPEKTRMTGKEARVAPEWYNLPSYYRGNPSTVIGAGADIIAPAYTEMLDFELELACVIGKPGSDISEADALSHVFGFTVFNDVSARDMQFRAAPIGMGPAKGKDFDTSNVLGPWIVTADEVGDPYALQMTARVNGEVWGSGLSGTMHYSWEEVIAFVSQSETLEAGEVFGSGTVGTGCGLEQGRYLKNNDVVELEIERIGSLRNRVIK